MPRSHSGLVGLGCRLCLPRPEREHCTLATRKLNPLADISISSAPATTTAIPTEMATLTAAAATAAVVAMAAVVVVVTAAVVEASVVTAAVTACPTLART